MPVFTAFAGLTVATEKVLKRFLKNNTAAPPKDDRAGPPC
jgi:hypothetical protein